MRYKPVLRVAAKVVIQAEAGILTLHPSDIDLNRKWHIPGGIRDDIDEPLQETAVRELREETGIKLDVDQMRPLKIGEWFAVDQGEKVKILAVFFHVILPSRPEVSLSHEHDQHAWLDKSNYKDHDMNPEVSDIIMELL